MIKNYTSTVPAATSMGRIEQALVKAGADHISKKYEGGVCRAIMFQMQVNNKPLTFKLPARVDRCFMVLWAQIKDKKRASEATHLAQAERTAWKIVADWVEIQLTMITLEQAEPLQLFLPYAYDASKDQTFYERLQGGEFKLLN